MPINPSEEFVDNDQLVSLCGSCRSENKQTPDCRNENATPFLRNEIFYKGIRLCPRRDGKKPCEPDCVYKYDISKVIAIEIKDQPYRNIEDDRLVKKIKSSCYCAYEKDFNLVWFILLVSSIKKSDINYENLKLEEYFNAYDIQIGKNKKLNLKLEDLRKVQTNFVLIKCKDLDEKYFNSILI